MALVPWRRREQSELVSLQDRVNRMFEDFLRGFPGAHWTGEQMQWTPVLDVSETDETVQVTAELPGVDPKEVDISLADDVLTIHGEKKAESEEKQRDYHRIERSYGSFTRTVRLPAAVDADKVEAAYRDGVLTIALPKKEEAKTHKVKVDIK